LSAPQAEGGTPPYIVAATYATATETLVVTYNEPLVSVPTANNLLWNGVRLNYDFFATSATISGTQVTCQCDEGDEHILTSRVSYTPNPPEIPSDVRSLATGLYAVQELAFPLTII
jgi:hypothetical protein